MVNGGVERGVQLGDCFDRPKQPPNAIEVPAGIEDAKLDGAEAFRVDDVLEADLPVGLDGPNRP